MLRRVIVADVIIVDTLGRFQSWFCSLGTSIDEMENLFVYPSRRNT